MKTAESAPDQGLRPRPIGPSPFQRIFADRWLIGLLLAGLALRLILAIGLHEHFRNATPPHLWPNTDEAAYFEYGLKTANALQTGGWEAFFKAPPSTKYVNWMIYKYSGIVLYLSNGSPLALRILSALFSMAAVLLFAVSLGRFLSEPLQIRFLVGVLSLLPSTAFWSALAIKEGILSFLTALLCVIVVTLWAKPRPWPCLACSGLICLILGSFRIWSGVSFFVIILVALLLLHPGKPPRPASCILMLLLLGSVWFVPNVQTLIRQFVFLQNPEPYPIFDPNFEFGERISLLENNTYPFPIKPVLAWLLPLPFLPTDSALMKMAGIENLAILFISMLAVRGVLKKLAPVETIWFGMAITSIVVATFLGVNLGTIYRNKSTALPFLIYFSALVLPMFLKKIGIVKQDT